MIGVTASCALAKENAHVIALADTRDKNKMLEFAAAAVLESAAEILAANAKDVAHCERGAQFADRLMLNESRLKDMAEGLEKLIELPNPIGEIAEEWTVPNGMRISKVRVPLGVIGIIYEARPNVTVDAIGLCIKTGNAIVLRGSKEAYSSNEALVAAVKARLRSGGYNPEFIQLIQDVSREGAETLMTCRDYVDVLIPRGSASLIRTVVEKSTVPVIETGAGNCHAYIEQTADIDKALDIVLNGKLRRPSVCNALESLLVDESAAKKFLPVILGALKEKGVEIVGCEKTRAVCPFVVPASEDDYAAEYLALKISVKVVRGVEEACEHINKYSTKHSEVIVTESKEAAEYFTSRIDSAAVYVNASTCFTDGFQFGFGAEMGISTQKLHARGPLGLKQLTSEKYVIRGNGQVRA
ncbi:glutamate-5-semialdehyde dehydrogenase [Pumilibacter intestinalis]|uniref:glutamate-5-semialdehyde dehydrogenase n=1 Tax=Pumilibacter intestinalis TaxID=2941511 RepID=UPI00203AE611|nr:glutamate-5-semialdehyde dehydrogenase [Pumilibacter intestinalis]